MSDFLRCFANDFAALDASNLHKLKELYSHDVRFSDPLHEIQGLTALQDYFTELYANVSELGFTATTRCKTASVTYAGPCIITILACAVAN